MLFFWLKLTCFHPTFLKSFRSAKQSCFHPIFPNICINPDSCEAIFRLAQNNFNMLCPLCHHRCGKRTVLQRTTEATLTTQSDVRVVALVIVCRLHLVKFMKMAYICQYWQMICLYLKCVSKPRTHAEWTFVH